MTEEVKDLEMQTPQAPSLAELVLAQMPKEFTLNIEEKFGNLITSVFITTPDQRSLKERLVNRGTDSLEVIEKRLLNAVSEMTRMREYDYLLVNDDFNATFTSLLSIAKASRTKMALFDTGDFIGQWANID